MLAAEDDGDIRKAGADAVDQTHHRRPFVGENDRNPDDVGLGRNPRHDFVEVQADEIALAVAATRFGAFADGVHDLDV